MPLTPRRALAAAAALAVLPLLSCSNATGPQADFVVAVGQDQLVVRTTDPDTIAAFRAVVQGTRTGFPIGPLRAGDGGYNSPWGWHFDEDKTRLTEAAVEVCDGTPSFVQTHLGDFPTYCPWSARILSER